MSKFTESRNQETLAIKQEKDNNYFNALNTI